MSCRSEGEKRRTRSLEVEELEKPENEVEAAITSSELRRVKRRILDKY